MRKLESLEESLKSKFNEIIEEFKVPRDNRIIVKVRADKIIDVAKYMKELGFDMPISAGAVDYIKNGVFEVFWVIWSSTQNKVLILKTHISREDPVIDSLVDIWRGVQKFERETWEMFGIHFRGHPKLKLLLLPDDWDFKKEGYPLSVLWGSWTRYTHFGYENAGKTIVFTVSKRSLRESSEVEITRFRGQESLLEKIIKWREREPVYIKRSKRDYKYLLGIPGLMVYISDGAYIAYRKEGAPDLRIEHGHNGNAKKLLDTIYTILSFSSKEFGSSSTRIIVPYYNYDTFTELFKYSTDWSIVPNCMAKILNLQKLLESYKPYLERKRVEYKVTLSIPGENVTLEIADRRVKITPGKNAGNKVVLNERDMVKLLFVGPETVGLDGKIKEIFPLPLFLWPLDHI